MAELPDDPLRASRQFWSDDLGDPDRFFTMMGVVRLENRLVASLDDVLRSSGLNRNGFFVLMSLEMSAKRSMILGRLADALMVHPTTVTLTVDKLEADGLVEKVPHERDRRAIRARLTRTGRTLVKQTMRELQRDGFGLGALTAGELAALDAAVTAARRAVGDAGNVT
jgi:DNA-binding MarR family transcriptional regulator